MLLRFLLLAVLLTACAQLPVVHVVDRLEDLPGPAAIESFRLEGRLSVKAGEKSFSGGIDWRRQPDDETLLLSTPLGQGIAQIRREGGDRMTLTDAEGRVSVADSSEALLDQAVGVRLPVAGLVHWLSARPYPGSRFKASLGPDGRVLVLEQDGWRIEYDRYRLEAGRWLPGRIFARRGDDLEFRLIVDAWDAA
jgi:outer membrane lipoprotein LolB